MKATKAHALKECDPLVKGMRNRIHLCPQAQTWLNSNSWVQNSRNVPLGGQSLSRGRVSQNTRKSRNVFLDCEHLSSVGIWVTGAHTWWYPSTGPENMKIVREEYLRLRDQPKQDTTSS